MATRVIVPPEPIMTPGDVPGSHAADDARIAALIAAATEEIDGPEGWLGRALGVQTLETTAPGFGWTAWRLPYPPLIEVLSVSYLDRDNVTHSADPALYEWRDNQVLLRLGQKWPAARFCEGAVRVQFKAGYNDVEISEGGTGKLPERVKQAIAMSVRHALAVGVENLFLRSEEVEGIGTRTYTVSTVAADLISKTTDRMLSGLRLYS